MSQEMQLGKYEFFSYDENIHRFLNEFLPTDEEREKQGENYLDELLERKLRSNPRNIQRRKGRKYK